MTELERRFHEQMIGVYSRVASAVGYLPVRYLQLVREHGGLYAARRLLAATQPSQGLMQLWERDGLHLSVEALVLKDPWRSLFSSDELEMARRRLEELGSPPCGREATL